MAGISLDTYQIDAVNKMKNGCILCGGVGSGKSRTALAYYYTVNGGIINTKKYVHMKDNPLDLYIITTARKRDTKEWEGELSPFLLSTSIDILYHNKVVVDSWNNIAKYSNIEKAFFIFDEQRAVGKGKWARNFIQIAKKNKWIMLSATPGDTWNDYIPVFMANGFYKSRGEFEKEHVVYSRITKFPKVDRYINTKVLTKHRNSILVDMDFKRKTVSNHEDVYVQYDISMYKDAFRKRWDPYKNKPYENAGEMCYSLRRIVNSDISRQIALLEIFEKHQKLIIFYNFDYELEILKGLCLGDNVEIAEWNGHLHQPTPDSNSWVYLVQYTAGCEGWNCIKTDTIVFYSQSYSYKVMTQAAGRIDRRNTPYKELFYYHLKSRSGIDLAISRSILNKKTFNESRYIKWQKEEDNDIQKSRVYTPKEIVLQGQKAA